MNKEELRKKVLDIVTYSSDEGTSGYLLSMEQVDRIMDLFPVDNRLTEKKGELTSDGLTRPQIEQAVRESNEDQQKLSDSLVEFDRTSVRANLPAELIRLFQEFRTDYRSEENWTFDTFSYWLEMERGKK